ncbi:MAG: DUF808 domain-containing protein [Gammaproteobacteria bacterium]
MAGSSLLALLDDIATLLDDISVMTKVAAKKTAGVLGDDLAVNAERVTGVRAERELPVVWAVAKGSAVNKLILVPAALLISAILPWAVTPLLMLGGAYLCYEGFEKFAHFLTHRGGKAAEEQQELLEAAADPAVDLVAYERDKIKGAIRTDFILSAEIIVIALGTVQDAALLARVGVLAAIAVLMTIGVYGFVAAIVKLDDAGLYLIQRPGGSAWTRGLHLLGRFILRLAPWLMKSLGVLGTAAMFLVGGGILVHGLPPVDDLLRQLQGLAPGGLLSGLTMLLFNAVFGMLAGAIVLGGVKLANRIRNALR